MKIKPISLAIGAAVLIPFLVRLILTYSQFCLPPLPNSYSYTEFLINFAGGFVRRGLLGDLLYRFCSLTGANPLSVITAVSIVAILAVVAWFVWQFSRRGLCWWILFSPLCLGLVEFFVRKDFLLYLVLIGVLYAVRERRLVAAWLFMVLGIFLHEAFVFFGATIGILSLLRAPGRRSLHWAMAVSIPILFLVMCVFKGDETIARSIIGSWQSLPGTPSGTYAFEPDNSIGALAWDARDTFLEHFQKNFDCGTRWQGVVVMPLVWLLIYYFVVNFLFVVTRSGSDLGEDDRTNLSALMICAGVTLLPMLTILSCDGGRIVQYATISSLAAFLILPRQMLSSLLPGPLRSISSRAITALNRFLPPSRGLVLILLVLLAVSPACYMPKSAFYNSIFGFYAHYIEAVLVRL